MADRVAVMYAGRIVEQGTRREVFYDAQHPYTWGLLGSIARLDRPKPQAAGGDPGLPPSLLRLPDGCAFGARCAHRFDRCDEQAAAARPRSAAATWTPAISSPSRRRRRARDRHPPGAGRGVGRDRERRTADVAAARAEHVTKYFPIRNGHPAPARGRPGARGRRRQLRAPRRARRSAWWGSPAAASPRWAGASSGCTSPPAARSSSRASDISKLSRRDAAAGAARDADGVPGPVRLAQPAQAGRHDHRRPAAHPQARRTASEIKRAGAANCSSWSGCRRSTSTATRTSSPAASGSGSASPGRWPCTRS